VPDPDEVFRVATRIDPPIDARARQEQLQRRRSARRRAAAFGSGSAVALLLVALTWLAISAEPGRDAEPATPAPSSVAHPMTPHSVAVVGLDGGRRRVFTGLPGDVFSPALSPDGTSLAFVTSINGSPRLVVSRSGQGQRVMAPSLAAVSPVWSPDGGAIAFVGWSEDMNRDIYVVDGDGGGLERLTSSSDDDETPAWSPDGTTLAFARNPTTDEFSDRVEIWSVSTTDGDESRLTRNDAWDAYPTWSPDGESIAYSSNSQQLWSMRPDGSDAARLAVPGLRSIFAPQWSPDGSRIVFLACCADVEAYASVDGSEVHEAVVLRVRIVDLGSGEIRDLGPLVTSSWNAARWLPSGDAVLVNGLQLSD
jgi:Tol biopolymer transport system component